VRWAAAAGAGFCLSGWLGDQGIAGWLPGGPGAPGLLILTDRWEIDSTTPGVERWLAELPDGDREAGHLPSAVLSLAGRALRASATPGQPGEVAVSRVLSRSGTWVILHGACLASAGPRRVAIIVEPAHPARIYPLLMSAYGLTGREKEVTQLDASSVHGG
jgi:hypothetical protein